MGDIQKFFLGVRRGDLSSVKQAIANHVDPAINNNYAIALAAENGRRK
jgi:hypothetical protein